MRNPGKYLESDLQKRPTKETYKIDLQKRPAKETCKIQHKRNHCTFAACLLCLALLRHVRSWKVSENRPTKETYKRDLQKRPGQKRHRRDLQKRLAKYHTKETNATCWMPPLPCASVSYVFLKRDPCIWKETYKRDLQITQKRPTQLAGCLLFLARLCHMYFWKETHVSGKRPTKETHTRDLQKRPWTTKKETYKRDPWQCNRDPVWHKKELQKRSTQETNKRDPFQHKRDLQKRPSTMQHRPLKTKNIHKRDPQKRHTKETLHNTKRTTKETLHNTTEVLDITKNIYKTDPHKRHAKETLQNAKETNKRDPPQRNRGFWQHKKHLQKRP